MLYELCASPPLLKPLENEQSHLNEKIEAANVLLQAMAEEEKDSAAGRPDSLKIPKKSPKFFSHGLERK